MTSQRLFSAAAVLLLPLTATAASVSFEIVADTTTADPASGELFTQFSSAPSINNGNVVFTALSAGGNDGVYKDVGAGVQVVADRSVVNPGPIGPTGAFNIFSTFRDPTVDSDGSVAWFSTIASSSDSGIYSDIGGSVNQLSVRNATFPGLGGEISLAFNDPHLNDGRVTYDGTIGPIGTSGLSSIVRESASGLERLAVTGQTIPGGTQPFSQFGFGNPITENGVTTFAGSGNPGLGQETGVFTNASGSLQPVALSGTTLIPGTTTSFGFINREVAVDRDGEDVLFSGAPADFSAGGIYGLVDGQLVTIVDSNTPIPGAGENFNLNGFFGLPFSYDEGNLLFLGMDGSFSTGLYALFQGEIIKLLAPGDAFNGSTITGFSLSAVDQALSGTEFVVGVRYSGGAAIVRGSLIPEPSSALLLAASIGATLLARRRG